MKSRIIIAMMVMALSTAMPVFASEITGVLSAGASSTVGGTVVSAPIASPAAGTYGAAQSVALSAPGSSSIRYTIDGSNPSCAGGGLLYSGLISVASSLTINAIACYPSGASSAVCTNIYIISTGTLSGTVATSSGGALSGTVISPSGGSLTGTVVNPSGGTLTGTVVTPAAAGGGGSSSGGGGGGGGGDNGPPVPNTVSTSGSGGSSGNGTGGGGGNVLGASTTVPNLPNTGQGGNAPETLFILFASAFAAVSGIAYLRRRTFS